MKKNLFYYLILILFVIIMFSTGCGGPTGEATKATGVSQPGEESGFPEKAALLVTRDFGRETIFEKEVKIKEDWTVVDLLQANLQITTKWGGDFVTGINGLESDSGGISDKRMDWFYYINGICADVGAASYELNAGDVVWWDYHGWKNMGFANSAVIGCFPGPFSHGYRGSVKPTTIMSSADNHNLAEALKELLKNKGIHSINIKELNNDLVQKRRGPTILLGEWKELKELPYLEKLNRAYKKTGTSVHFVDQGVELLNYCGNAVQTVKGSAGVIVAAGEGLGDDSPLWLVAGTDREGLQQALEVLVKSPGKISKAFGLVIESGKIIRLPLQESGS